MNWTTVFPAFTDDFVEAYERDAEINKSDEMEDWFSVARTFNPTSAKHLVVFSLFWKPAHSGGAMLPNLTRDVLLRADELGLVDRFAPWEHYVLPLLEGARRLREARPEVGVRIYLAADLYFLVNDFLAVDCEICLMRSSSVQHNPGAMWRFLALEEQGRLITVSDADRAPMVEQDVKRTEAMNDAGLGFWRVPVWGELNTEGLMAYRPILACQFGTNRSFEVSKLMKAFVWHSKQETFNTKCYPPGASERYIYGTKWPDYGFDEWFLLAVIFPRAAASGMLTFVPSIARSQLLPLDIEYCTWSEPKSEIVFFGSDDKAYPSATSKTRSAKSVVLSGLLNASAQPPVPLVQKSPLSRATIVVARYNEDLTWLLETDGNLKVVVYNKGREIRDKRILERINVLKQLPNVGRESDTYLAHLESGRTELDDEWTVFTQGNPFVHSPHFLDLLHRREYWNPVQPLTACYDDAKAVPPQIIVDIERREWIGDLRVRTELFSLFNCVTLGSYDREITFGTEYAAYHQLADGWSVAGHFLEQCGLHSLARNAWRHYLGQFVYGAIFAVRKDRLDAIPMECLSIMRKLACSHWVHGFFFERMWLHLFGMPFHITEEDKVKGVKNSEMSA